MIYTPLIHRRCRGSTCIAFLMPSQLEGVHYTWYMLLRANSMDASLFFESPHFICAMVLKMCVCGKNDKNPYTGGAAQPRLRPAPPRLFSPSAIKNKIHVYVSYMQCTLGKDGVSKVHGFGSLSAFEQALVDDNVPALIKMAQKGSDFVKSN